MAACTLATSAAPAAGPVPSSVEVLTIDQVGDANVTVIDGVVLSDRRQCVPGRKVKAIAVTPSGDVPIDTGISGKNGGWQARDTDDALSGSTALKLRLPKTTVKTGKKTIKCDGATVQLT